jgi:hypothetical protein
MYSASFVDKTMPSFSKAARTPDVVASPFYSNLSSVKRTCSRVVFLVSIFVLSSS